MQDPPNRQFEYIFHGTSQHNVTTGARGKVQFDAPADAPDAENRRGARFYSDDDPRQESQSPFYGSRGSPVRAGGNKPDASKLQVFVGAFWHVVRVLFQGVARILETPLVGGCQGRLISSAAEPLVGRVLGSGKISLVGGYQGRLILFWSCLQLYSHMTRLKLRRFTVRPRWWDSRRSRTPP